MDTSYLIEAASRAYDFASDINLAYEETQEEEIEEDQEYELDDDIQMSFRF